MRNSIPMIAVPLVGKNKEEILEQIPDIRDCDVVEWRLDTLESLYDIYTIKEVSAILKKETGCIVLLTFRTFNEGGSMPLSQTDYIALCKGICENQAADWIDVELFSGEELVKEIIETAHQNRMQVIVSNHDFERTVSYEEIITRLKKAHDLGADYAKAAMMPKTKEDVLTLLEATYAYHRQYPERKIITMSMGDFGQITRVTGEIFGSSLTFGALSQTSAPGQMPAEELKNILDWIHEASCKE